MGLSANQIEEVNCLINLSLDVAERNWALVGQQIVKSAAHDSIVLESISIPSLIPKHKIVSDGIPQIAQFVALVVDMRKSTERLSTEIRDAKVNKFQRVYYETSALLPALAKVISYEDGSVTEFLGDGVLALFSTSSPPDSEVKAAFRAAENCIGELREQLNSVLHTRYNLPPMSLGAGLALGQTMVTVVGVGDNIQPKALGPCIYEASKLSGGTNRIIVSETMKKAWPKTTSGRGLKFERCEMKETKGFSVRRPD